MNDAGIREDGDRMVVSGSLTIPQAARLLESGAQLAGSRDTLFDLAEVEQIDSSGIAVVLGWLRAARAADRALRVANAPESLRSIARLYGVEELLPLV